jgi:F-type H+-transporting ATPase subunit b
MITFAVFVWFCMKYIWPPLMAALEERNARISEGLAAAQRGQQDLEDAQARVSDSLNDAKQQAQEIINQAQKRANEIVDEAKDSARDEADKIKVAATADIDQQINSAREELRKEVSSIALAGAAQILKREVDAKAGYPDLGFRTWLTLIPLPDPTPEQYSNWRRMKANCNSGRITWSWQRRLPLTPICRLPSSNRQYSPVNWRHCSGRWLRLPAWRLIRISTT